MSQDYPPESGFVPLAAKEAMEKRARYRDRPRTNVVRFTGNLIEPQDGMIEPTAWEGQHIPGRRWIVNGLIPRGEVTMLTGNGGEGKSLLTVQLLTALVTGTSWLGLAVPNVRALGVYCEDDEHELMRRTNGVLSEQGLGFGDLDGLSFVCRKGKDSVLYEAMYNDMTGTLTTFYHRLRGTMVHLGAQVLVLDSLYNFFAGNENNRAQANQFINALCEIAQETDGAVVLVAHPSMQGMATGSGTAGNTAWHNAVRSRLYLHRKKHPSGDPDKKGPLVLEHMKGNYAGNTPPIELFYEMGRFVPVVPPQVVASAPTAGNLFGDLT